MTPRSKSGYVLLNVFLSEMSLNCDLGVGSSGRALLGSGTNAYEPMLLFMVPRWGTSGQLWLIQVYLVGEPKVEETYGACRVWDETKGRKHG
jgi:hypothetical protein